MTKGFATHNVPKNHGGVVISSTQMRSSQMGNRKLHIFVIIFSFIFTSACSSKISPVSELRLQATSIPIVLSFDEYVYDEAFNQPPSALTNKLYEASFSKAMLLQRMLRESKTDEEFESMLEVKYVNSLCLMAKFLLSTNYRNINNFSNDTDKNLYFWIEKKQLKWKEILKNENPAVFSVPCLTDAAHD